MTRLLGSAAWACSTLAAVSLALGVVAAPVGMLSADEPAPVLCGGNGANGCTGTSSLLCNKQGTPCATVGGGACTCLWANWTQAEPPQDTCGCGPDGSGEG